MRSELDHVKKSIVSKNTAAVKAALRSCQFEARRFFDDDQVSIDDFKSKLRYIFNCYKQGDSRKAFDEADRLFAQIEMLITHLTDSSAFPDSAILAKVTGRLEPLILTRYQSLQKTRVPKGNRPVPFRPQFVISNLRWVGFARAVAHLSDIGRFQPASIVTSVRQTTRPWLKSLAPFSAAHWRGGLPRNGFYVFLHFVLRFLVHSLICNWGKNHKRHLHPQS